MRKIVLPILLFLGALQMAFSNHTDADLTSATYDVSTQVLVLNGENFSDSETIDIEAITFDVGGVRSYTLDSSTPVSPDHSTTATIPLSGMDVAKLNWLLDSEGTSSGGNNYEIQLASNWHGTEPADAAGLTVSNLTEPSVVDATYDAGSGILQVNANNLATDEGTVSDINVSTIEITGKNGETHTLSSTETGNTDIIGVDTFSITVDGDDKATLDTLFNRNGTIDADSNNYSISFNAGWNPVHGNSNFSSTDVMLEVVNGNFPPIVSNVGITGQLNVDEELTGTYDYQDFENDPDDNSIYLWYRADDINGTNRTLIGSSDTNYILTDDEENRHIRFAVIPRTSSGPSPGDTAWSSWSGAVGSAFPRLDSARYNANSKNLTLFGRFNQTEDIETDLITIAVGASLNYTLSSALTTDFPVATQAVITLSGIDAANLNYLLDNTGYSSGANDYEVQLADEWHGSTTVSDTGQLRMHALSIPTITSASYHAGTGLLSVDATNLATNGSGNNDDILVSNIQFSGKSGLTHTLANTSNVDILDVDHFEVTVDPNDKLVLDTLFNANGAQDSIGIDYEIIVQTGWNPVHSSSPQDTSTSLTVSNVNFPPVADDVTIDGTPRGGNTLSGDYDFNDGMDDEGDSEYLWYRANDSDGSDASLIVGANEQDYTLVPGDESKYLRFAVIPYSEAGLNPGDTAFSDWEGPVQNASPEALNVAILYDTLLVGDTLAAYYEYDDFEGDEEGNTTYRWRRADNDSGDNGTNIGGATDSLYILTDDDLGKFIRVIVNPKQIKEGLSGGDTPSDYEGSVLGSPPSAAISGIDTICPGEISDSIKITLTGEPNWTVIYAIDGVNDTITAISESPYTIDATEEGEYILENISNDLYSSGSVGGNAELHIYQTPTAELSGDTIICNSGTAEAKLPLSLTGTAPWSVTYSRNGSSSSTINNIQTANYEISVSDTGLYELTAVSDAHCDGTVSGTAKVGFHAIPTASISGSSTICEGSEAEITVNLNGYQPFDFTYYREGSTDSTTVSDNQAFEYTFNTSTEGTYKLKRINDSLCPGLVSGQPSISKHPQASAVISGNDSICDDGSTAIINVDFQGVGPYSFTYTIDDTDTITRTNVGSDPYSFQVTTPGVYKLIAMEDQNCDGSVSGQATINAIPTPTATISGNEQICENDTAQLMITLTGAAPWNLTYTINGINPKNITGIMEDTIFIDAHQEGNYILSSLSDSRCGGGSTSGIGVVEERDTPQANMFGGESICVGDTSDNITVVFTGSSPYSFAYSIDGVPFDTIHGINSSPYQLEAHLEGTYTIDWMTDQYCQGNTFGSGEITVNELPEVEITGLQQVYSSTGSDVLLTGTPSGGIFSGTGVIMNQGDAYFSPSTASGIGDTHYIQYEYTDGGTGCTNTDVDTVFVINADGEIIIQEEKDVYCFNDDPFLVNGVNIAQDTGSFKISGNAGLTDHGDNTATVDPGILEDGIYTITYTYFDEDTFHLTKNIEVEYIDSIWIITNLPDAVCANGPSLTLTGNNSSASFSGEGVAGSIGSGFEFRPPQVEGDSSVINYGITTVNGCSRDVQETVLVNPIADIDFALENTCVDVLKGDSATFINNTTSADSVITWNWNFDDTGSGSANTSSEHAPKHYYSVSGIRNVQLTATTEENCTVSETKEIIVSDIPVAGFTTENNCYQSGVPTRFVNSSSSQNSISEYEWQIGDSVLTTTDVEYNFSGIDAHEVTLAITNEFNCVDSIEKEIILKPVVTLADESYEQNFEGNDPKGWISRSDSEESSWLWDVPDGATINSSNKAWYTNITGSSSTNENSWVSSPCFNFEDTEKPMVKMDIWRDFEGGNRDGANLQYTVDNGATWDNVGSVNSGIEWYQTNGINGNPGGLSTGWSRNDSDDSDDWENARHSLDHLIGEEFVQFRIAYGAENRQGSHDGFAFDNFWLGERSRVVLLEHFTNSADSESRDADQIVNNISTQNPLDVIDLQYHAGIGGTDPLNQDNPVDVSDRLFYYSLSDVPFSYMNGTEGYDYDSDTWNKQDLVIESLKDKAFDINISGSKNNSIISGDVTIEANRALTSSDISLYIIIVEAVVDGEDVGGQSGDPDYRQVVKSMEPNSAGTNFLRNWQVGDSVTVGYTYQINQSVYNIGNLRVVAFVQDENSGEVYQASSYRPQNILGIGDHRISGEDIAFTIYPNPVNDYAIIKFTDGIRSDAKVRVMDNRGALKETHVLYPGSQTYEIDVTGYEPGFYMFHVISEGRSGVRPVIISKTR